MPIFDQGYQHWNGALTSHARRWWAVTRQGLRAQLRNRRTKYLVISAWVPALLLAAFLALWGLFEQKSSLLQPFFFLFQALPDEIKQGPKAYRTTIWTVAFHWFLWIELGVSMLLVLLVGPDLISQDLRFNAIPLYLSRPMRRFDYFLGKLGVIATFLAAVLIVPAVLAYVIGVGFSMDISVVRDTWRILAGSVAYGLIVAVVCGLVMLALSSLSRNSRLVAMMWAGVWLITWMISGAVGESLEDSKIKTRPWELISFTNNLHRIRQSLLDTGSAARQLEQLVVKAQEAAKTVAGGSLPGMQETRRGPFGIRLPMRRRPNNAAVPPPPPDVFGNREDDSRQIQQLRDLFESPYPWTWSAGVLLGLSVLAVGVLSTRVRSLDRLK